MAAFGRNKTTTPQGDFRRSVSRGRRRDSQKPWERVTALVDGYNTDEPAPQFTTTGKARGWAIDPPGTLRIGTLTIPDRRRLRLPRRLLQFHRRGIRNTHAAMRPVSECHGADNGKTPFPRRSLVCPWCP